VQEDDAARQMLSQLMEKARTEVKTISDARDFTAFAFSLPAALEDESPMLYAVDSQSQTMALDTVKINASLSGLGATSLLNSSLDGTSITVSTPPAVFAEYDGLLLAASQTMVIDAPDAILNGLKSGILSIPAIPEDLRVQLTSINPRTRDVYLPVVEGLGRETDLGGATGYIYAAGDLAQVLGMMPGFADDAHLEQLQNKNASALIWTKNGVLYCLTGEKSDSELTRIARSIG
jgi:hypothetical protein